MESKDGMDEMEALCKKLTFLSSKNKLKWHGSKNDLLRFLTLHLEVQPNQFRANDNGSCAVFKFQNITCNSYHKARTLQIQGKEDADKLRNDLINLTSIRSHPVSEKSPVLSTEDDLSKAENIWKSFWTPTNLIIQIRSKIAKLISIIN